MVHVKIIIFIFCERILTCMPYLFDRCMLLHCSKDNEEKLFHSSSAYPSRSLTGLRQYWNSASHLPVGFGFSNGLTLFLLLDLHVLCCSIIHFVAAPFNKLLRCPASCRERLHGLTASRPHARGAWKTLNVIGHSVRPTTTSRESRRV